ncbi:hypothetical protein GW17_00013945 [Ensete ventricosum]|nr:hypothetical protein GW17_00013945 [Ensete ventricosum]
MNHLAVEPDDSFSSLLELAANNDVDAFRRSLDRDPSAIDEFGLWYGREKGSNRIVLERRTPLMVAATYGSLDVLGLLLSLTSSVDINRAAAHDGTTALHCAASGGSPSAADAVKLVLSAGADPNSVDANGHRPADVVVVPPKLPDVRTVLEQLLGSSSSGTVEDHHHRALRVTTRLSSSDSPPLSSSPDANGSPFCRSASSPVMTAKAQEIQLPALPEKKEYPVDPSIPDIKNSIYATDEFRMYSFKVRPCSRAYSHDWTECPFVHPGENARRRDPRKYHYSCVPCPDFRKGACARGDMCEYAHGVFECWLHPAQYRTRLCKDGTNCSRRVCFFAHTREELRPLYVSTGSAVPSPLSSMETAAAMGLMPGSPSSVSAAMPPFTPAMSPSANGHSSLAWAQPNVPVLHLPGSNLQASRLRSSLSARDMPLDDFSVMHECDAQQLIDDLCYTHLSSSLGNRMARSKTLAPSNLDDLFSADFASSPKYKSDEGPFISPSHKAASLGQFQQQQSLLSPINTVFSAKATEDHQLSGRSALLQVSLGVSLAGRMSPRSMEPMNSHLSMHAHREKQLQTSRSLSHRDLGSGTSLVVSSVNASWSKWASSPSGTFDWGVNGDDLGLHKQSLSFELQDNGEEPDLSWVHSLVRESPPEKIGTVSVLLPGPSRLQPANGVENPQPDSLDEAAAVGAFEQMQLDQMAP